MSHVGWVILLAGVGALLQLPLLASSIRERLDTNALLQDPSFNVIDGGDASGNPPPSGWERLARVTRPSRLTLIFSAVGILFGLAAAAVGALGG